MVVRMAFHPEDEHYERQNRLDYRRRDPRAANYSFLRLHRERPTFGEYPNADAEISLR